VLVMRSITCSILFSPPLLTHPRYPHQVWWFLACLIFLISACQLVSRIHGLLSLSSRLHRHKPRNDVESNSTQRNGASSLRRLPIAVLNAYRVIAFRTTLSLGPFSLNLAEAFLTCAYIIALFTWLFINSKSHLTQMDHGSCGTHVPQLRVWQARNSFSVIGW
jgi:hypothetical protein